MLDIKRRYTLAKAIYKDSKLGNVAAMLIRFIEEKQKNTITEEMFLKAIKYIEKQREETINNQGFVGLALKDLQEVYKWQSEDLISD